MAPSLDSLLSGAPVRVDFPPWPSRWPRWRRPPRGSRRVRDYAGALVGAAPPDGPGAGATRRAVLPVARLMHLVGALARPLAAGAGAVVPLT